MIRALKTSFDNKEGKLLASYTHMKMKNKTSRLSSHRIDEAKSFALLEWNMLSSLSCQLVFFSDLFKSG